MLLTLNWIRSHFAHRRERKTKCDQRLAEGRCTKVKHNTTLRYSRYNKRKNGLRDLCPLSACKSAAVCAPKAAVSCIRSHQVLRPDHRKVSRIHLTTAVTFAMCVNILYVLQS